ncbi:DNA-formamidopyrimidine glycosylase family protein [Homoserinibacter sp. GY 40078]|uniref:DNA-formamidopyrimidine glycosylase family protein n=1 Tax=Homoserinibacter sp. GY 40078 TaxID=2603275 RepID=UPI0011CC3128|nr:DNA-formamidopyrimidine glycosylase family protein [Homoserinibacter sp. GY 40078]TXK19130.1 Fpg/Nei family DNA glycosylase [Homoserinibacter sp. GY 40078]
MPEGDTVYRTARQQHDALAGRVLRASDFRVPEFATIDLAGETVHEVVARGKHLLHRIGDWTVHSHLKMEGAWRLFHPGERWSRPAFQARVVLTTEGQESVGFELGVLEVLPTTDEQSVVGHLGPDPLGDDWNEDEAARRIASDPEVPVFAALLDQRNLAGVGNVYANEVCFVRGVMPSRAIGDVDDVHALVRLAYRMLNANRDRWTRSTTGDLRPGRRTWVYSRTGEQCRRCGTRLEGGELGRLPGQERVVTWCPSCQT